TSAHHTRRVKTIWAKTSRKSGIEGIVVPSRDADFNPDEWWRGRRAAEKVLHEYLGLAAIYLGISGLLRENSSGGGSAPFRTSPKTGCAGEAGARTEHQSLTADLEGHLFSDRPLREGFGRGGRGPPPNSLASRLHRQLAIDDLLERRRWLGPDELAAI